MDIYTDFLSRAEIEFITQRKQKSGIIAQLNRMGISFKLNANGFPVVRRDYDQRKSPTKSPTAPPANESAWVPNVLRKSG